MLFNTAVLIGDTINRQTNTVNRTEKLLKIPAVWKLTSWLFTRPGGFELGTSELQIQRPNH